MYRNLFFLSLGAFGGLWLAWPGIITNTGWSCAKDIVTNVERKPTDVQSLLDDFERKLKIGSAVSPQTLLKGENLKAMDKLRILGDACFR